MKKPITFLFFLATSILLYLPTRHAGFVHDAVSWMMQYDKYSFWEGLKVMFGDKSLHPVYHILNFSLYKIFGINSLAWFFVAMFLHASVAHLGYCFFSRYLEKKVFVFLGCLLFLISPYQTEAVVWKATLHYLVAAFCILKTLNFYLDYEENGQKTDVAKALFYFVIGLLSLEIGLISPVLLSILILGGTKTWSEKINTFSRFVLPQMLIVVLFFVATKLFTGGWTGHYGASVHLNFSPDILVPNLLKHSLKLITFGQYNLSLGQKEIVFAYFQQKYIVYGVLFSFVALAFLFIYKSLKNENTKILVLLFMTLTSIIPVLNLFFYYVTPILSDRFSYLYSLFFLVGFIYLLSKINRFVAYLSVFVLLFFSVKYLLPNVKAWQLNDYWVRSLMKDFRWNDNRDVYILNCFDNNGGAMAFHTEKEGDSSVREFLEVYRKDVTTKAHFEQLYMYNTHNEADTLRFHKNIDSTTFKLVIPDGTWFWKSTGVEVKPISKPNFETQIDEWGVGLSLKIKNEDANAVYIYQQGDRWREVKF